MTEPRATECILIIGTNGTGKSTAGMNLIKAAAKKRRALVIDYAGMEKTWYGIPEVDLKDTATLKSFTDIRKALYAHYEDESLDLIYKNYHNGILVMDDARNYLEGRLDIKFKRLLIGRRQKMVDIVAMAHGFEEIPPRFYNFYTKMVLFRTVKSPVEFKKHLSNYDQILTTWKRVNQRSYDTAKAWTASGKVIHNRHYAEVISPFG